MKNILITSLLAIVLVSCWKYTPEEISQANSHCAGLWKVTVFYQTGYDDAYECRYPTVQNTYKQCIDDYKESIRLKYKNPDTVSALTEDDYSQVVKTCKESFPTE